MANYEGTSRTNYFRVTDEEKYKELFDNLSSEFDVYDFTKDEDGVIWHGFGAYGSIDYYPDDEEDAECDFDAFLEELQKILPDDEAFIYFEVGHEKLRYVSAYAIVCTSKEIKSVNLGALAVGMAKDMLGSGFETRVDY